MELTRIGVIGLGNMGRVHSKYIFNKEISGAKLTAVADTDPEKLKWCKDNLGDTAVFDNTDALLNSGLVDSVLIAIPHYDHPRTAIKAFEKGLHVLCEKPAGVYTKQVKEMNAAASKSDRVFSMMYNQRTNPLYQKTKELIDSKELGDIKRTNWIITTWYRSQSYYDSGGWRATWKGEGGGVLLNQSPHQLDLWQWICGMPVKVRAFMSFGKYHDIEVEDDVTAYVEYPNGATGVFITSTGESPGTNRFEIAGDKGKIVIENGNLEFYRLRISERQFNRENKGSFGAPDCWKCEIPVNGTETGHRGITQNWIDAIRKGTKLLAPGLEGINGLELSNAMYLSSWLDKWIDIPVDDELFYIKLQQRS